MGLSRTVFELVGDFSRKLQNFPTPVYFATPLTGFPLELFIGVWGQNTRVTGLSGQARSFRIYSAVWIQCTNMPDGQTAIGRQQTPRLRIASRGEKKTVTIVLKDSRVLCWKVHSWVDSEMKRQIMISYLCLGCEAMSRWHGSHSEECTSRQPTGTRPLVLQRLHSAECIYDECTIWGGDQSELNGGSEEMF